jgi:hypothetical protein
METTSNTTAQATNDTTQDNFDEQIDSADECEQTVIFKGRASDIAYLRIIVEQHDIEDMTWSKNDIYKWFSFVKVAAAQLGHEPRLPHADTTRTKHLFYKARFNDCANPMKLESAAFETA